MSKIQLNDKSKENIGKAAAASSDLAYLEQYAKDGEVDSKELLEMEIEEFLALRNAIKEQAEDLRKNMFGGELSDREIEFLMQYDNPTNPRMREKVRNFCVGGFQDADFESLLADDKLFEQLVGPEGELTFEIFTAETTVKFFKKFEQYGKNNPDKIKDAKPESLKMLSEQYKEVTGNDINLSVPATPAAAPAESPQKKAEEFSDLHDLDDYAKSAITEMLVSGIGDSNIRSMLDNIDAGYILQALLDSKSVLDTAQRTELKEKTTAFLENNTPATDLLFQLQSIDWARDIVAKKLPERPTKSGVFITVDGKEAVEKFLAMKISEDFDVHSEALDTLLGGGISEDDAQIIAEDIEIFMDVSEVLEEEELSRLEEKLTKWRLENMSYINTKTMSYSRLFRIFGQEKRDEMLLMDSEEFQGFEDAQEYMEYIAFLEANSRLTTLEDVVNIFLEAAQGGLMKASKSEKRRLEGVHATYRYKITELTENLLEDARKIPADTRTHTEKMTKKIDEVFNFMTKYDEIHDDVTGDDIIGQDDLEYIREKILADNKLSMSVENQALVLDKMRMGAWWWQDGNSEGVVRAIRSKLAGYIQHKHRNLEANEHTSKAFLDEVQYYDGQISIGDNLTSKQCQAIAKDPRVNTPEELESYINARVGREIEKLKRDDNLSEKDREGVAGFMVMMKLHDHLITDFFENGEVSGIHEEYQELYQIYNEAGSDDERRTMAIILREAGILVLTLGTVGTALSLARGAMTAARLGRIGTKLNSANQFLNKAGKASQFLKGGIVGYGGATVYKGLDAGFDLQNPFRMSTFASPEHAIATLSLGFEQTIRKALWGTSLMGTGASGASKGVVGDWLKNKTFQKAWHETAVKYGIRGAGEYGFMTTIEAAGLTGLEKLFHPDQKMTFDDFLRNFAFITALKLGMSTVGAKAGVIGNKIFISPIKRFGKYAKYTQRKYGQYVKETGRPGFIRWKTGEWLTRPGSNAQKLADKLGFGGGYNTPELKMQRINSLARRNSRINFADIDAQQARMKMLPDYKKYSDKWWEWRAKKDALDADPTNVRLQGEESALRAERNNLHAELQSKHRLSDVPKDLSKIKINKDLEGTQTATRDAEKRLAKAKSDIEDCDKKIADARKNLTNPSEEVQSKARGTIEAETQKKQGLTDRLPDLQADIAAAKAQAQRAEGTGGFIYWAELHLQRGRLYGRLAKSRAGADNPDIKETIKRIKEIEKFLFNSNSMSREMENFFRLAANQQEMKALMDDLIADGIAVRQIEDHNAIRRITDNDGLYTHREKLREGDVLYIRQGDKDISGEIVGHNPDRTSCVIRTDEGTTLNLNIANDGIQIVSTTLHTVHGMRASSRAWKAGTTLEQGGRQIEFLRRNSDTEFVFKDSSGGEIPIYLKSDRIQVGKDGASGTRDVDFSSRITMRQTGAGAAERLPVMRVAPNEETFIIWKALNKRFEKVAQRALDNPKGFLQELSVGSREIEFKTPSGPVKKYKYQDGEFYLVEGTTLKPLTETGDLELLYNFRNHLQRELMIRFGYDKKTIAEMWRIIKSTDGKGAKAWEALKLTSGHPLMNYPGYIITRQLRRVGMADGIPRRLGEAGILFAEIGLFWWLLDSLWSKNVTFPEKVGGTMSPLFALYPLMRNTEKKFDNDYPAKRVIERQPKRTSRDTAPEEKPEEKSSGPGGRGGNSGGGPGGRTR